MNDAPIPDGIPLARPVGVDGDEGIGPLACARKVAPPWPAPMSRLRSVVELLILLACGIVGSWAAYVLSTRIPLSDPRWHSVLGTAGVGALLVLVCFVTVRVAGRKPVSVGWTCKDLRVNAGIGLGAWVATYVILCSVIVATCVTFPSIMPETPVAQQKIEQTFPPMRLYWIIPLTIFVAFWEEIVFRGFVLTRLNAIFKRWWLTILLASAVFGVAHAYEGLLAALMIGGLAMVMGTLFVWRRSLVPSIVFHFLHNLVMFVLLSSISKTWQ